MPNKAVPPSPACGMCIDSPQEPILIAALPPSSNPAHQCLVKKIWNIGEQQQRRFFFLQENQYQIARKLSAEKFQELFIEHNPD